MLTSRKSKINNKKNHGADKSSSPSFFWAIQMKEFDEDRCLRNFMLLKNPAKNLLMKANSVAGLMTILTTTLQNESIKSQAKKALTFPENFR